MDPETYPSVQLIQDIPQQFICELRNPITILSYRDIKKQSILDTIKEDQSTKEMITSYKKVGIDQLNEHKHGVMFLSSHLDQSRKQSILGIIESGLPRKVNRPRIFILVTIQDLRSKTSMAQFMKVKQKLKQTHQVVLFLQKMFPVFNNNGVVTEDQIPAGYGTIFLSQTVLKNGGTISLKDYCHQETIKYIHFISIQNSNEIILDPILIGILKKDKISFAFKTTESDRDDKCPRIVVRQNKNSLWKKLFQQESFCIANLEQLPKIGSKKDPWLWLNSFYIDIGSLPPMVFNGNYMQKLINHYQVVSDGEGWGVQLNISWMMDLFGEDAVKMVIVKRENNYRSLDTKRVNGHDGSRIHSQISRR